MAAVFLLRRAAAARKIHPLRDLKQSLRYHRYLVLPFNESIPLISHPPLEASRCLSTLSKDSSLVAALRDEVKHEKELEDVANREMKQPPAPFTIVDKPGMEEVYLHRSYGDEDITVACLFQSGSQAGEDEEEDGNSDEEAESQQPAMVQLTVKISKGGDDPYLEFGCTSYGDEPLVDRLSFKESCDVADLPYEGPHFSTLDEKVKDGFRKFLSDRGINASLGEYILEYMYHKEQREYSRWLNRVESFLSK